MFAPLQLLQHLQRKAYGDSIRSVQDLKVEAPYLIAFLLPVAFWCHFSFKSFPAPSCIKPDMVSFSYISIGLQILCQHLCDPQRLEMPKLCGLETSTGRPTSEVQNVRPQSAAGMGNRHSFGLDRRGLLTPMESQTGTLTMMVVDPKNI